MSEKVISMFDPINNVFREVKIEVAKKFIEESKKLEAKIKAMESKPN